MPIGAKGLSRIYEEELAVLVLLNNRKSTFPLLATRNSMSTYSDMEIELYASRYRHCTWLGIHFYRRTISLLEDEYDDKLKSDTRLKDVTAEFLKFDVFCDVAFSKHRSAAILWVEHYRLQENTSHWNCRRWLSTRHNACARRCGSLDQSRFGYGNNAYKIPLCLPTCFPLLFACRMALEATQIPVRCIPQSASRG